MIRDSFIPSVLWSFGVTDIFEKIHVTERKMDETQKNEIAAYADGVLIPIEEVDDDTFAQKVLGDGIAIIP